MRNLPVIGLTGGMGSGKSTVSAILAARGGCILDADKINHEQMRKGRPMHHEIVRVFGTGILDERGEIVRRLLGMVVFGDEAKLQTLVDITHGHVLAETVLEMEALRQDDRGYKFIVIDAPLLIEANMQGMCDSVWVVTADDEMRVTRVLARDGLSREQVQARMRKQLPQYVLASYADYVIQNNDGVETLEKEVDVCLRNVLRGEPEKI